MLRMSVRSVDTMEKASPWSSGREVERTGFWISGVEGPNWRRVYYVWLETHLWLSISAHSSALILLLQRLASLTSHSFISKNHSGPYHICGYYFSCIICIFTTLPHLPVSAIKEWLYLPRSSTASPTPWRGTVLVRASLLSEGRMKEGRAGS